MPGHGEGPEGVTDVLNGIPVQHNGRLWADAHAAEQFRHRRGRDEFAIGFVPVHQSLPWGMSVECLVTQLPTGAD